MNIPQFVVFPYLSLCGLGSLPVGLWSRRPSSASAP